MKTEGILYDGEKLKVPLENLSELYEATRKEGKPFWFDPMGVNRWFIVAGHQGDLVVGFLKSKGAKTYHFVSVSEKLLDKLRTGDIRIKFRRNTKWAGFFENGVEYASCHIWVRGKIVNFRGKGEQIKWLKL